MNITNLTYIFPAVLVAFILMVFAEYFLSLKKLHRQLTVTPKKDKSFHRRDFLAVVILTAAYACVAFLGLGSTKDPENFCHFAERGQYALVELNDAQKITNIRYYCGINMGFYRLQLSDDGTNWTDMEDMQQDSGDVLKWYDADLSNDTSTQTKYIRIVASDDLYLGEIAVYGEDGSMIPTSELTFSEGVSPLLDEQDTVPDEISYRNSTYFDEVYHARTALENVMNIYPYEVSHPPLGKLIISLGIRLLGMNPFGWRFMGTLFGAAMLPCLYVFLKKIFGGMEIPVCCTLVFAFDFMHFTQTRIATIDTYGVFFIILMYFFMYLYYDRDSVLPRKKDYLFLGLSGVFFGFGAASKWTCIYAGGGLAVIWLLDCIRCFVTECRAGEKKKCLVFFLKNAGFCLIFFVVVPCMIYYMSYYPYGRASGLSGIGMYFKKEYFHIVIDNQKFMFTYHNGVTAEHPYSSRWYQWILDIRPILYYLDYGDNGQSSFGAFVSPLLCWSGLIAVLALIPRIFRDRDRKALFILIGYLAQLLPWTIIGRTTFEYHYFPSTVFLVLAMGYVFDRMEETPGSTKIAIRSYTVLTLLLFAAFYPVLTGIWIDPDYGTKFLKWMITWPF